MTKTKNKKILFLLLIFVSFILISAFVIEHELGHQPCNLCIYERVPYFLSIFLIAKIFFTNFYERETLFILSLVFIISTCFAFYHFGIEQGFFKESLICTAENLSGNISKKELLEKLSQNTLSCKDVNFRIFSFSLASINTILSIILSATFIKLFISYEKN